MLKGDPFSLPQQPEAGRIRHGRRPAFDYEVFAIAEALAVNPVWLASLSDEKQRTPGMRRILQD